jgi:hypothetical protein
MTACKRCEAEAVDLNSNGVCGVCAALNARDRGECGAVADDTSRLVFRCRGQSYDIDEATCNGRQARGDRRCPRCTMRIGGLNDPRR